MSRGGIKSQVVENSAVGLGGNEFETAQIRVAPNSTVKKGAVLKRDGARFALVTDMDTETPAAINPFDIENINSSAADMSFRAIIFGKVRADLLNVSGKAVTSPAHFDKIRSNTGCIPIQVNDISRTE